MIDTKPTMDDMATALRQISEERESARIQLVTMRRAYREASEAAEKMQETVRNLQIETIDLREQVEKFEKAARRRRSRAAKKGAAKK